MLKKGDSIYYDDGVVGEVVGVLDWALEVKVPGEDEVFHVHPDDAEKVNQRNAPGGEA